MRKVTFGCANSLDNFIARPDRAVDWLVWSSDVNKLMQSFWKTIDTVVMGRKTFEVARGQGGSGAYPGVSNYVCSRTLSSKKHKDVHVVSDAVKLIRRLKRQKGKGICIMGGGELATSLFAANLIDEVGVNIHPVLLGAGIPLFHPLKRQINLELIDCQTLKHGCVYLLYRVQQSAGRSS
jgi:dihydrofolate reductase